MYKSNSNAKWKLYYTYTKSEVYKLDFCDNCYISLEYFKSKYAIAKLYDKNGKSLDYIAPDIEIESVSSVEKAMQIAETKFSIYFHNKSVEYKELEKALTNCKGFKELSAQNL